MNELLRTVFEFKLWELISGRQLSSAFDHVDGVLPRTIHAQHVLFDNNLCVEFYKMEVCVI